MGRRLPGNVWRKDCDVLIIGHGLSAIVTAEKLMEMGVTDIALFAKGEGVSWNATEMDLCLNDNAYGDTAELFAKDIKEAGRYVQRPALVEEMTTYSQEVYDMLVRWGAVFAKDEDGNLVCTQTGNSSKPRTLQIDTRATIEVALEKLKEKGAVVFDNHEAIGVLVANGEVEGITIKDPKGGNHFVYAPRTVAAWGGIGNLMDRGPDHYHLEGAPLGFCRHVGAKVVDMEFLQKNPETGKLDLNGGLLVDLGYRTSLTNLYAVGDACGGILGAGASAGVVHASRAISGYVCAKVVAEEVLHAKECGALMFYLPESTNPVNECPGVYEKYVPLARTIAFMTMRGARNDEELGATIARLNDMLASDEVRSDDVTHATILTMRLMLDAAKLRRESRGVHKRKEFTEEKPEYAKAFVL